MIITHNLTFSLQGVWIPQPSVGVEKTACYLAYRWTTCDLAKRVLLKFTQLIN